MWKSIIVSASVLVFFSACAFKASTPNNFATYDFSVGNKSINAEQVVYNVKVVDNEPYADPTFWSEAVVERMKNAGYRIVSVKKQKINKKKAALIELAAPYGAEDFTYLITLIFNDKKIVVVESAGEVLKFQKSRKDIIAAIEKIKM